MTHITRTYRFTYLENKGKRILTYEIELKDGTSEQATISFFNECKNVIDYKLEVFINGN